VREGGGAADDKKTAALSDFGAQREREQHGRHRRLFAGLCRAPLLSFPRRAASRRGRGRRGPPGWGGGEQRPVGRMRKEEEDDDGWDPCVSGCGGGEVNELLGFGELEMESLLE